MKQFAVLLLACLFLCGISSGAILDHRYDLKLLMHGNLEPPALSTSDFRDSSRAFQMPKAGVAPVGGIVNTNSTQAKYGNASIFINNPSPSPSAFSNITVPDDNGYTFGLNNHSISMWVYWPIAPTRTTLYDHRTDGSNYDQIELATTTSLVYNRYRGGGTIGSISATVPAMVAGKWYQIALIQNGTTADLYVNGTSYGSAARTASMTDLTGPVVLSQSPNGAGAQAQFMDEVIITNGGFAPTIDELQGEYPLYLNGTFGEYADDNYTISLLHFDGANGGTFFKDQYGNRSWTVAGVMTTSTDWSKFGSASYSGNNAGWLTTDSSSNSTLNFGASDFTLDVWMKPNSTQYTTSYFMYAEKLQMYCDLSGNVCRLVSNQSGSTTTDLTAPITVSNGVPFHVAFVRNGTSFKIYQDGVLKGSKTLTGNIYNGETGIFPRLLFTNVVGTELDEFRITKGLARWTANFTPPTTPYELITNQTWTPTPDASGTIPVTIQFNDTTPSTAWTNNTYTWDFGDAGTSTIQNPSHVYSTTGMFQATGNVFNNNMTTSLTKTIPIGAPDVEYACTPLRGTAALLVTCTDLTTNYTPITSYLFDFGDGITTTDAPPWTHVYSNYGAFSTNLTEVNSIGTGFKFKRDYIIVSTEQNPPQVQSYPVYVRFIFNENFGTPLSGVNITITPMSTSTGSYTWLEDLIGIPLGQVPITNQTMYQVSGTDGVGAFYVIPTTQYNITFSKTGYTFNPTYVTTTFTNPQAVYIWGSSSGETDPNYFEDGLDENSAISFSVTTVKINGTASFLNMTYSDITATTSGGSVTVVVKNSTPYGANSTAVTWPITGSSVTNSTLIMHGVAEVNGESYLNTTTTRFGYVAKSIPFSMKGQPVSFMGFGPEIALLFALFIMMMTVMLGTAQTARQVTFGGLSFEMWVFYAIGWFDSLVARGVPEAMLLLGMTIVTVVAIFAIFEIRKKKEKY